MSEALITPARPPIRTYLILAIGLSAVAAAAILIRLAQAQDIPSLLIANSRLIIATVVVTPITLNRYLPNIMGLSRRDIMLATLSGLFLALHFVTWVTSLEYTSVLISVVLVTTSPLWVALLEVLILKTKLNKWVMIGILIAILGSIVIGIPLSDNETTSSSDLLYGSILSLIGAIGIAVYLVIGRSLRAKLPIIPYIWLVYGIAALLLLILVIVSATPLTGYSTEGYLWLLALGLIPQLIGHSSINYALAYLQATFVSLTTQLEPIGSAILAFFIFNEIPQAQQIIGSMIILGGVALATFAQSRRFRSSAEGA